MTSDRHDAGDERTIPQKGSKLLGTKGISKATADGQHAPFIEMVDFLSNESVVHIPIGARFYTFPCSGFASGW